VATAEPGARSDTKAASKIPCFLFGAVVQTSIGDGYLIYFNNQLDDCDCLY